MNARTKVYVGIRADGTGKEVFHSDRLPTVDTHGDRYLGVVGPFVTLRGARYAARYSGWITVHHAERRAKNEQAFLNGTLEFC